MSRADHEDGKTMTVVIVEDDDGLRESLTMMLGVHGLPSRAYASAEAFLDDAHMEDIRLLLLDQQLPGMSGIALMGRLAASGGLPPTVLVTARLTAEIKSAALSAGADAALEKPLEFATLMSFFRG